MHNTLHLVFCIDTEGPLYESPEALAQRVWHQFNLRLELGNEALENMRRGFGVPVHLRDKVARFLHPKAISNAGNWDELNKNLSQICAPEFRNQWPDSQGDGLAYTWFCMDHVGYNENPRRRIIGHHAIFDEYAKLLQKDNNARDSLQFHYHPLPYNRKANACATWYFNDNHLMTILSRKIIDRGWFPSVFRPGFHTIRPDSNWFLEQWIPYDYSNQACEDKDSGDLVQGQFGDWRRAPALWGGYHPHHDDYQRAGNCRRWIFRCLYMQSRIRVLSEKSARDAFNLARKNGVAVLAITDHDFRDMASSISAFIALIRNISQDFPDVAIKYSSALDAARAWSSQKEEACNLSVEIRDISDSAAQLIAKTSKPVFGPQPWLAIKGKNGDYYYDNFDFGANPDEYKWSYVFSWQTFPLDSIESIGVAAPSSSGVVDINILNPGTGEIKKFRHGI